MRGLSKDRLTSFYVGATKPEQRDFFVAADIDET